MTLFRSTALCWCTQVLEITIFVFGCYAKLHASLLIGRIFSLEMSMVRVILLSRCWYNERGIYYLDVVNNAWMMKVPIGICIII